MIDLHIQEVLEEIRDAVNGHLEDAEQMDDSEERFTAAEEVLQEILDKISPLLEREL